MKSIGNQVWNPVALNTRLQVGGQVRDQVKDQVGGQVVNQVVNQVGDQVWDQVWVLLLMEIEQTLKNGFNNVTKEIK